MGYSKGKEGIMIITSKKDLHLTSRFIAGTSDLNGHSMQINFLGELPLPLPAHTSWLGLIHWDRIF